MIEITTLGTFSVELNGKNITDKFRKTQKLWKLLNVLLINRKKPSSINSIVSVVWANQKCENPTKSLHNLIFRLRKLFLAENSPEKQPEYIIFTQNCYMLNLDADLRIDVYELEDIYLEAGDINKTADEKIFLFNKIISLYNGKFLSDMCGEVWAKTAAERYEKIYVNSIAGLADLYYGLQKYNECINVCNKAIEMEILEEKIYFRLIKSMQNSGQKINAVSACEDFFERLRRKMGVSASSEIISLYKQLKSGETEAHKNINAILDELPKIKIAGGVLCCCFDAFKTIIMYKLMSVSGKKENFHVVLFSIDAQNLSEQILIDSQKCLRKNILIFLNRGDVVSDYSNNQTVVLIKPLKNQDIGAVCENIKKKFYEEFSAQNLIIAVETKKVSHIEYK